MKGLASVATGDRTATRDEVLACRGQLRDSAHGYGLLDPRVDDVGTVIVRSSEPGYGSVRRFASEASTHVGVWVNVITAEVLEMIRQLVADGRDLYDRDWRQRWALERGGIFAGNLAECSNRSAAPPDDRPRRRRSPSIALRR